MYLMGKCLVFQSNEKPVVQAGSSRWTLSPTDISKRIANELTHCGLVTPYGDIGLGQHWLR